MNQSSSAASDSSAAGTIQLTVELADAFYTKVDGEETVYIYAQPVNGPRAPLAATKVLVKDLPVSITLDDSYAVMTTSKLSDHKEVRISARVSYSGDAITKSGDLMGAVSNVMVGQSPVTVTINEVSP